jgi:hypothetical protein
MKWLVILGSIGAAAVAVEILILERRGGLRRPSLRGQIALAVLTALLIAAAVYLAHVLGLFSIPLVVAAFVPVGIGIRWLVVATRAARRRAAEGRTAVPVTARARLAAALALPAFVVLVVAVVALGLIVGNLVGPH